MNFATKRLRFTDRHALIVFLHGIGDCIMATACVRTLREKHPDMRLSLLVRGDIDAIDVWSGNPHVDAVYTYDEKYPEYWHPTYHFKERWALQSRFKKIAHDIGATKIIHITTGALPSVAKRLLRLPPKQDVIARQMGVRLKSRATEVFLQETHRTVAKEFLADHKGLRFIAVNRCAANFNKFWEIGAFEGVCKALSDDGYGVIQCYTPQSRTTEEVNDGRRALSIRGMLDTSELGSTHLLNTAAVLEQCEAVISVDTSIMHLGAAVNRPVVGIFTRGNTDVHLDWPTPFYGINGQPSAEMVVEKLRDLLASRAGMQLTRPAVPL